MSLAMRWLAAAERTELEVRSRLLSQGFSEPDADYVIERLNESGFLSDERVLEREAERASNSLHTGKLKAKQSMLKRGLDEEAVEETVREMPDEAELLKARHILRLKLKPGDAPARAARILAARGFDEEIVRMAVAERFPDLDWA